MSRLAVLALMVFAFVSAGLAGAAAAADADQPQPEQPREGDRGDRGGRRGFDPARMREMASGFFKEQLGATDDEWKVLQPKLDKLLQAQMDARFGGFGGFRGRRGGGDAAGNSDQPQSAAAKATSDLRQALEANASPEEINKHLTALREARAKAKAELEAAQKDLQSVLTPKQEAQLVMFGMLD